MADSYVYIFRDGEGRPLYVGKGTNNRERHHAIQARRGSLTYWHRKLKGMIDRGEPYTVERAVMGLTDDDAFEIEHLLIEEYGRKKFDEGGLLYNLDDGGLGASSEHMRQMYEDDDFRRRQKEGAQKAAQSEEWRKKVSEASKRAHQRPDVKKKQSARMQKQWADKGRRETHSEKMRKWFSNPKNKQRHAEALKAKIEESPEIVDKRAESIRKRWQEEGYREKMSEKRKADWEGNDKRRQLASEQMKQRWADPEYRKQVSEKLKRPKTGKTLTCKQCGSEFYAVPARVRAGVKFCSMDCYSDSRANPKRSRRKVKNVSIAN